jgi:hypothetical protein
MLNAYYHGSGHALVLEGASSKVSAQSGTSSAQIARHPRRVGYRAGELDAAGLAALLQNGEVIAMEETTSGGLPRTVIEVTDGTNTVDAIFAEREGRGFYPDMAAYRLDRLLDLDMVPVTVMREVDGDDGSVQFFPANSVDEAARAATGGGGNALCAINDQWAAMYVFDVLVYNQGRSQQRMLYDRTSWQLMLTEYDRAFDAEDGRPPHLRNFQLTVTPGWKSALAELSDQVLEDQLGDVLDKKRRRALANRRDMLLATD